MKKLVCVLMIVLSLITGTISADAHCKGPHGPIDVPTDTDKK
jgi:hypothetical protein